MQDLPLQGSIPEVFLPRLIARLHRAEFEGTLRVTVNDTTKVLYFRRGEIASAASNADSDRLANILIRDGRLSQEQLDLAKNRVQPAGSLGKALIEMGFLTPGELLQGARRQVHEILASCFSLRSGAFHLEPGPLPPEVTSLGIPTRRLIFDSVLQAGDRSLVVGEIGSMESVYRPTADLRPLLLSLKLEPDMDRVGRTLDGLLSLRDLSGRTHLDDFTVSKVVLALDILGLAERLDVPSPAPARPGRIIPIETEATAAAAGPVPEDWPPGGPGDDAIILEIEDEGTPLPVAVDATEPGIPAEPLPEPGDRGIGLTPERPPDPEPPPIPAEDLPAFARPPGEPEWQIDPATGERVHLGPVEVTFDGRVSSPPGGGPSRTRFLFLGAGAVLLAGAIAAYFALRSGSETVVATGAEADGPAAVQPPPDPGAMERPPPSPAVDPEPLPVAPAPDTPAAEPAPAPSPRPEAAGPFPAARRAAALRALDAGDTARSASIFGDLVALQPADGMTLQILIACQEETVRNAGARAGSGGSLFFLPYSFKGRDCYRVCWGVYATRAEAEAAIPSVPEALLGPGSRPVPMPLARLRSGS